MTSWPFESRGISYPSIFAIVSTIIFNHGAALGSEPAPAASTSPSELALLKPWPGAHGGLPPFDRVQVDDFKPAIEAAMEDYRREIEVIASRAEPADFTNTIAALEKAGRAYGRVRAVYGVWSSTMSAPEFQAIERDLEPRLAAFSDEITQNEKLFRRIEAVYESPEKERLTPEEQRLVWLYYTNFVRAGAKLDPEQKARVAAINQRLATLYTTFSQNLLADEQELGTVLASKDELAGLPDSVRSAAAAEAVARDLKGQWVIANTRSSAEPFLTYSDRRDLREKVWRRFVSRGDHKGERDNKPVAAEILQLRAERAKLLGYQTHAHWRLENTMARTPDRAMELMEAVWPAALGRVREEVADMQKIADAEGTKIKIEPWDYRYYAEKVRKAKYDLDENEIKPYLQLEKLVEGMFWMARELYGLNFTPAQSVPVYHPDVRVWEVRQANGQHVGMFYFDPYARPGKRSGAWMSAYRTQERFAREITPLISNNSNFMKAQPGEAILISWIDAQTLFHEFGHALHGLCSDVNYPSLSGTRVARDFVELPSQLKERWLPTPELLNRFALHHQTGKAMPAALVEKIRKATTFNQGFATTEFLASGLLDMKLHLAGDRTIDPAQFEREELARLDMPSEIVMRHRLPQFAHIFASDSYSAGYYSYLWADTLTADAAEAFLEGAGLYDQQVAARLRKQILSRGNTLDPAEAYRNFRGRDAGIEALMRYRGFPIPGN
jgi:peptidyl-dipeptidase Dcp